MYVRRRSYRKRPATKKRTYKKRRSSVSTTVKRYVNRAISKNVENKKQQLLVQGEIINSYSQNPLMSVFTLIPYYYIGQGTGQGDRIGNRIRTKSCILRYTIYPVNSYSGNPITIPQEFIMYIGKVRNSKAQSPVSADFAKLYQNGDSARAPNSNLSDLISRTNNDWFQIYKIVRHKIGFANSQNTTNANSLTFQGYANNDFKLNVVQSINVTKYCPKVLVFNDNSSQQTNDGLWCWMQCVNADGSTTTSTNPLNMSYNVDYVYEDA